MRFFQQKTGYISETVRDGPTLLQITNRKWHTLFWMKWKSWTLDDLEVEGQYCNRCNCSASSLATAGLSCLKKRSLKISLKTWRNTF